MWFNSMQREEPYQDLTWRELSREGEGALIFLSSLRRYLGDTRTRNTGGAWLSSARAVRCWVKSRNERNPRV